MLYICGILFPFHFIDIFKTITFILFGESFIINDLVAKDLYLVIQEIKTPRSENGS